MDVHRSTTDGGATSESTTGMQPGMTGGEQGGAREEIGAAARTTKDVAAQSAAETASTAKASAQEVAGAAASSASQVAGEAKEHARRLTQDALGQAQGLAQQARGEAMGRADEGTRKAAGSLRTLSTQFRALSEGRPHEAGPLGDLTRSATDQLSSFAQRLDEGGVENLMQDVRRFARRRPGMFLLACAGAGFVAGRVARAERSVHSADSSPSYRELDLRDRQAFPTGGNVVGGEEGLPSFTGVTYGERLPADTTLALMQDEGPSASYTGVATERLAPVSYAGDMTEASGRTLLDDELAMGTVPEATGMGTLVTGPGTGATDDVITGDALGIDRTDREAT